MAYFDRYLADGERILYRTRLHWIIFIWPVMFSLAAYVLFTVGFNVATLIAVGVALFITYYVTSIYLLSEFVVTNRRVVGKVFTSGRRLPTGRSLPKSLETPLMEARDVEFKAGILGTLVNYGSVVITDNQGKKHSFGYLPLPTEFYRQLHARLTRNQRILK